MAQPSPSSCSDALGTRDWEKPIKVKATSEAADPWWKLYMSKSATIAQFRVWHCPLGVYFTCFQKWVHDVETAGRQKRWSRVPGLAGVESEWEWTVLAIAGNDYALIATDTRLSQGFSIHSRECPKTFTLTDNTILGCCGFHGDVITLTKTLSARLQIFEKDYNKPMPTPSIAAMLSTILYYRRFFPYYTHNVVAGLDEDGKGCVYSFDPVGSYEREVYRAKGSASAMLQPLLDNQIGGKNQQGYVAQPMPVQQCIAVVKDVFTSAAERDIYTGDNIVIAVVTKDGIQSEKFPLRKD